MFFGALCVVVVVDVASRLSARTARRGARSPKSRQSNQKGRGAWDAFAKYWCVGASSTTKQKGELLQGRARQKTCIERRRRRRCVCERKDVRRQWGCVWRRRRGIYKDKGFGCVCVRVSRGFREQICLPAGWVVFVFSKKAVVSSSSFFFFSKRCGKSIAFWSLPYLSLRASLSLSRARTQKCSTPRYYTQVARLAPC